MHAPGGRIAGGRARTDNMQSTRVAAGEVRMRGRANVRLDHDLIPCYLKQGYIEHGTLGRGWQV
jgi:hypothetical protein